MAEADEAEFAILLGNMACFFYKVNSLNQSSYLYDWKL